MQGLPIIFIHSGDSFYLKYALNHAKKFNPTARIILIGDNVTQYPDFVEFYPFTDYAASALKFRKVYKHMSIVPEPIERFCFERWFVLDEFLKRNHISKCLTLDSDVLLFEDAVVGLKKYSPYAITLANRTSGGFMHINNARLLSKITAFMLQQYSEKKLLAKLVAAYKKLQAGKGGGISDMKLLSEFYKKYPRQIGEITDIIDEATYDAGILTEQGFYLDDGIKKIVFKQGLPYCISKTTGKQIRMCCLHFQGPTKFYMKYFAAGHYGAGDKLVVHTMMFVRNNFSKYLGNTQRQFVKKMLGALGF